jgi:hypothetical protein
LDKHCLDDPNTGRVGSGSHVHGKKPPKWERAPERAWQATVKDCAGECEKYCVLASLPEGERKGRPYYIRKHLRSQLRGKNAINVHQEKGTSDTPFNQEYHSLAESKGPPSHFAPPYRRACDPASKKPSCVNTGTGRDLLEQALQAIQFDTAHGDMGDKADAYGAFGIAFIPFQCVSHVLQLC